MFSTKVQLLKKAVASEYCTLENSTIRNRVSTLSRKDHNRENLCISINYTFIQT